MNLLTSLVAGVPKETFPGERRVALVPAGVPALTKAGFRVVIEPGAGLSAGFSDREYTDKGAQIAADRAAVFAESSVVLQVRAAGANLEAGKDDIGRFREGQMVIASCDPLSEPEIMREIAARKAVCVALELVPRITRAQSMDVLSSMATIAGYKAVLMAADTLPRMFPLMMTAAGTITPAKVFVMGAGVAGLQAIATARRLGALVQAYDVRPAVKEQVESLGGRFVVLDLETEQAEGKGGYAKEMGEEFLRKQREKMAEVTADSDVVITTAAIPGKKSPVLVTAEMVAGMQPGSVIIDLAAERGGNCELTKCDETVVENGVTILGPSNLPTTIPVHASEMYSKNISTLLLSLVHDGQLRLDMQDEVVRETVVTLDGEIAQSRIRQILGLDPVEEPTATSDENADGETAESQDGNDQSVTESSLPVAKETKTDGDSTESPNS